MAVTFLLHFGFYCQEHKNLNISLGIKPHIILYSDLWFGIILGPWTINQDTQSFDSFFGIMRGKDISSELSVAS
jgi:hypothetical protein